MPIQVTCAKCKTSFKVSEKFAGKEGPCPKCKAVIKIPEVVEAPPEVTIHEPEAVCAASVKIGGGGPQGIKPLTRKETSLAPVTVVLAVVGVLLTIALTYLLRDLLQAQIWLRGVGLALVSIPIVRAGYAFLREEEIEPHQGWALWVRSAVCGLVYSGLWLALYGVLPYLAGDAWSMVALVPAGLALLAGGGAAFATLDIEFGNGFFLCAFYAAATLCLGAIAGLQMPWVMAAGA